MDSLFPNLFNKHHKRYSLLHSKCLAIIRICICLFHVLLMKRYFNNFKILCSLEQMERLGVLNHQQEEVCEHANSSYSCGTCYALHILVRYVFMLHALLLGATHLIICISQNNMDGGTEGPWLSHGTPLPRLQQRSSLRCNEWKTFMYRSSVRQNKYVPSSYVLSKSS